MRGWIEAILLRFLNLIVLLKNNVLASRGFVSQEGSNADAADPLCEMDDREIHGI